ncbi:Wzy polymerase domain-containing protein [Rhodoferax sp.]|uniref:PglL family O-oligosaccharyltransferase n=1 Tax=Rhodoferax sp. TaxID=50421 RepID=UPI0026162EBD|nr:Wzy polymerase domain-containing protein [Rhodoferax sp.]MDD2923919.1 Wzy polymerase domain-containing protein [Rhodoferax sp.]
MPHIAAFLFITLPWLNPFSPGPAPQAGPLLFSWVCAAGVFGVLAVDRQRGEDVHMVRALALAWVTAAVLSAAIGLLQYFEATARFGVWLNHTEAGQAFGNLRQRNQFATLLNMGLVALVWLATRSDAALGHTPQTSQSRRWLLPLWLASALVSAANVASSSRTGLLQLALVTALTLWWWRRSTQAPVHQVRHVQLVVLSALAAYAVATVVLPLLAGLDPFASGAWARLRAGDEACFSRLTLWRNVLHLIAQKPWLGWGWGELDYAHFITLYPDTRFCDILDNAHNLPLHLAVEGGVPLALLVVGTSLWWIWRQRPWRERHPTRQLAWGLLAVILLHSLLEYPLWYGPFQTAALLSVWLLWWLPGPVAPAKNKQPLRPLARYLYTSLAIVIVAYCGIASWHYQLVSQIYLDPSQRMAAYRDHTLEKLQGVWLYQDQVHFAELTTTELSPDNAPFVHALAQEMLHFSPEARVVELLLDSARLLGRTDEVAFYSARYQAAFPAAYALWAARSQ